MNNKTTLLVMVFITRQSIIVSVLVNWLLVFRLDNFSLLMSVVM